MYVDHEDAFDVALALRAFLSKFNEFREYLDTYFWNNHESRVSARLREIE